MYSVKNLMGYRDMENITAQRITRLRINDPVLKKPLNNLFIKDKGCFEWNGTEHSYYSTRNNKPLSINDLFEIDWELSF